MSYVTQQRRPNYRTLSKQAQALDSFLKKCPKGKDWACRQAELGLRCAQDYEAMLKILIPKVQLCAQPDRDSFAVLLKAPTDNAQIHGVAGRLRRITLLSFCLYLEKNEVPDEVIDGIVQDITGAESEANRRRIRTGVRWLNKLILKLAPQWGISRATELIIHVPLSNTALDRMQGRESLQQAFDYLSTEQLATVPGSYLVSNYSLPGLLAGCVQPDRSVFIFNRLIKNQCVDGDPSFHDLCRALGYDPSIVPPTSDLYRVHLGEQSFRPDGLINLQAPPSLPMFNQDLAPTLPLAALPRATRTIDLATTMFERLSEDQRPTRSLDPERPIIMRQSSIGRVELVLKHVQIYIHERMLRNTTISSREEENNAFDNLRIMQDKIIYGVGIMTRKPTRQAWNFIEKGCEMVGNVLLQQSRSLIRLLLRTFGGEDWDHFRDLRSHLLQHFANMSVLRLGMSHPLSIMLNQLQHKDVLESALEQVFLILLDTLEKSLDSRDDELRFLRIDLCFLLRQRGYYDAAEKYGLRFLADAESIHGTHHAATRGFLLKVGDVYLHQKLHGQAINMFTELLRRIDDASEPKFDIATVYAHRNLARIFDERADSTTSRYHWEAVIAAAWRIREFNAEKSEYFTVEAEESLRRQGFVAEFG